MKNRGPGKSFGRLTWKAAADRMVSLYDLTNKEEFHYALEKLDGIYMQNEVEFSPSSQPLASRRRRAKAALASLQKRADHVISEIELLLTASQELREAVGEGSESAALMKELFPIDVTYDMYFGGYLSKLLTNVALNGASWKGLTENLREISDSGEFKPSKTGEAQNLPLIMALEICRAYLNSEGIGWSLNTIEKSRTVRESGNSNLLKGKAERLVVAMLEYSQIPFTFKNLNGIWKDIKLDSSDD